MSTVVPATSLREQEAYAKGGVDFLDAPVFGSKNESVDAKLWIMAAGKKAVFEKVKPVLEHLGQTIHYFGKNGNAAAMKLVGNSSSRWRWKRSRRDLSSRKKPALI